MTFLALSLLLTFVIALFVAMLSGDSGIGCATPLYLLGIILCGLMVFGIAWLVAAVGCAAVFGSA